MGIFNSPRVASGPSADDLRRQNEELRSRRLQVIRDINRQNQAYQRTSGRSVQPGLYIPPSR